MTLSHSALGGTGTNTWHLRSIGALPPSVGGEECSEIINDFYTDRAGALASGLVVAFDGELVGVGPDEGTSITVPPWSVTGSGGGNPLPPFVCVCMNWLGSTGDRSKRGRTFIGPIDAGQNDTQGTIENTELAAWRAAGTALVSASEGLANGAVGIWSRQEAVFRDAVDSQVADQFASLRSRRD